MRVKEKVLVSIEEWCFKTGLSKNLEGISICDLRDKDDGFEEAISSSIKLIKSIDPRRYKTVQNEIQWIVNSDLTSPYGGRYRRITKGCVINFRIYSDDHRLVSAFYAGLIIHEATHGLLCSKGVRHTQERRVQIERICTAEENRFYQKVENIHPEYEGYLVREFDPEDWNYSWNTSKWMKMLHALQRIVKD